MTLAHDRHLQTGIVGSIVVHALLLLLLAWVLSLQSIQELLQEEIAPAEPEPEVTMIFPEQILLPPPVEKKPQLYIRTTQNEAATTAPSNAPFISDKSSTAASQAPAVIDATLPMPTMTGDAPQTRELADRDTKDGELKNDSVAKGRPIQTPPAPPPTPPSILKPQPPAPPPTPPQQTAKAEPTSAPLAKMMEEMDKESPRADSRLPLEVRRATPPDEAPPRPSPPTPPAQPSPQVRMPEDTPPSMVKTVPAPTGAVPEATPKPEPDAFAPFTRRSKTDGAIKNPGADAVDAEATPMGSYMRKVTHAVEKKWHLYTLLGRDSLIPGNVRFRFFVDKKGTPQDLKILSDARDADPRTRELTLRAVLDAQIPPIPPDLLPDLEDGRLKIEYEFLVY